MGDPIHLERPRMRSALLIALTLAFSPALPAQMTPTGPLPGSAGWYLRTDDRAGELFVYEIGKGEPVVVLHGGPGADLTYLLPVSAGLQERFRFVFYDQRGSLRSRVPPDSITMAKHVADLEALRVALGVERIHLLSHSAGTLLAFEYLKAHPQHVGRMVLAGALPHKNGRAYYDAEYAALWKTVNDDMNAFGDRPAVREAIRAAGFDRGNLTPRQRSDSMLIRQVGGEVVHVERWRNALPLRVNWDAARRTRETTNFEYDVGPALIAHPHAVTVINGDLDYTVGPKGSPLWTRLAASAPASRLRVVVLPEASHLVWVDQPERFRLALLDALTR